MIFLSLFAPSPSKWFIILKKNPNQTKQKQSTTQNNNKNPTNNKKKKNKNQNQKVTAAFSEQLLLPPGALSYMKPRKELYTRGKKAFVCKTVRAYI